MTAASDVCPLRTHVIYSCKVPNCKNAAHRNTKNNKKFFNFPRDSNIRHLWKQFCDIKQDDAKLNNYKICEDHFLKTAFIGKNRICKLAVPVYKTSQDLTECVRDESVSSPNADHDYCFSSPSIVDHDYCSLNESDATSSKKTPCERESSDSQLQCTLCPSSRCNCFTMQEVLPTDDEITFTNGIIEEEIVDLDRDEFLYLMANFDKNDSVNVKEKKYGVSRTSFKNPILSLKFKKRRNKPAVMPFMSTGLAAINNGAIVRTTICADVGTLSVNNYSIPLGRNVQSMDETEKCVTFNIAKNIIQKIMLYFENNETKMRFLTCLGNLYNESSSEESTTTLTDNEI